MPDPLTLGFRTLTPVLCLGFIDFNEPMPETCWLLVGKREYVDHYSFLQCSTFVAGPNKNPNPQHHQAQTRITSEGPDIECLKKSRRPTSGLFKQVQERKFVQLCRYESCFVRAAFLKPTRDMRLCLYQPQIQLNSRGG